MKPITIITASEFRANQKRYFDMAEQTLVVVTRAGKSPVIISVPNISQVTDYELQAIQKGLEDAQAGRTIPVDVQDVWGSIL